MRLPHLQDAETHSLCIKLGEAIVEKQGRLITIESCTGGGVASAVTETPGSSAWFDRALVTYSNQAKMDLAAVSASVLNTYGAVSIEVAEAMAIGGLLESDLDVVNAYSIAITGIAGPDGGSEQKPVGLVCFAWGYRAGRHCELLHSSLEHFSGDRAAIRSQSVRFSLNTLIEKL